jgi:VWFA-related protein
MSHLNFISRSLLGFFLAGSLLAMTQQEEQKPAASTEGTPASIGILLDNSGSMKDKRKVAIAALETLVKASNPNDEFFVVNFNISPYLDLDYTSNPEAIFKALERADAHGGTSLYDAVIAAAVHFEKGAKYKKKIIVLLTDGGDNNSRMSLPQVVEELHKPDMPALYCIGMFNRQSTTARERKQLDTLAQQSGGKSFYPNNKTQLNEMALQIAQEIRALKPTLSQDNHSDSAVQH